MLSIWTVTSTVDRSGMPFEECDLLACSVPNPGGVVTRGSNDMLSIWTVTGTVDLADMPFEECDLLACGVPNPGGVVK